MIHIYKQNGKLSPILSLSNMAEPDLVQNILKPQSGFCLHGVQGRESLDLKMDLTWLNFRQIILLMLKIINTTIILHISLPNSHAKNTKQTISEHFLAAVEVSCLASGFISFNFVQVKHVCCLDADLGKVVFSSINLTCPHSCILNHANSISQEHLFSITN